MRTILILLIFFSFLNLSGQPQIDHRLAMEYFQDKELLDAYKSIGIPDYMVEEIVRQELEKDITKLKKLKLALSEDQLISIIETITGAGCSIFAHPEGTRFLILANPKGLSGFQYQITAPGMQKPVPTDGIIMAIPSISGWEIKVDYFGLITKQIH